MLNTTHNRIAARRAAVKAEADADTGKPAKGKGTGARAGENIRGNLFRGATGQFQAGPAGQLRQRIEAIREMRKAKGKKPKGGKGKAAKPTPEQQAAAAAAEIAANRAATFSALGLPEDAVGALDDLMAGAATDDDGGLVKLGLAEVGADGTLRLTAQGRAVSTAASQGDLGKAKDAASRGRDAAAKEAARAKAKTDKETAKQDKEKASGSGGKEQKRPAPKEEEAPPDKEAASQAKKESNRAAVVEKMMANDAGVSKRGMDAMAALASGEGAADDATVDQLTEMGLAERAKDGTPRLTTQGRAAVRAAEKGDYGAAVDAISRAGDAAADRREQEAEAPGDEALTSEAAAAVGLDDDAVDALRQAADEGGARHEALTAAGLLDDEGSATTEGIDALEALEKGDIRGYRRAARKARARMRRERAKADKDTASRTERDAERAKRVDEEVSAEVERIDAARRRSPDKGRGFIPPTGTTKMIALPTVADLLTAQIGRERYANAFYTALATWADAEGYDGLKAWADNEAAGEMGHAQTLIAYGRDRDITGLPAIPAPPVSFPSYTTALTQALDLERQVSAALQALTATARALGDEPTALIASDLLRGQVESEKELKTLIQRFVRADAATLDLLDHELMETP